MDQSQRVPHYHSFILRLWQEGGVAVDGSTTWRVSLEDPHSAERVGFKNLDEFFQYLARWSDKLPSDEPDESTLK